MVTTAVAPPHCRSTSQSLKFPAWSFGNTIGCHQWTIDVRDIIEVPEGQLAPWGYIEYLPDRFAPGPTLTNTPTIIPQPR